MDNAKPRRNIATISYWGDCIIRQGRDSNDLEVQLPNGVTLRPGEKREGEYKTTIAQEFRQIDFFDPSYDYRIQVNDDTDIFVPASKRKSSKDAFEKRTCLDTPEKKEEM